MSQRKTEAATRGLLLKEVFLTISQNSQENTCVSLVFNKVAGLRPQALAHVRDF